MVLGLNLILGIVVDTFGELRTDRAEKLADIKGTCFICSLPAHSFDTSPGKFAGHVKNEHNMWDYIYYVRYLKNISPHDRNFNG